MNVTQPMWNPALIINVTQPIWNPALFVNMTQPMWCLVALNIITFSLRQNRYICPVSVCKTAASIVHSGSTCQKSCNFLAIMSKLCRTKSIPFCCLPAVSCTENVKARNKTCSQRFLDCLFAHVLQQFSTCSEIPHVALNLHF